MSQQAFQLIPSELEQGPDETERLLLQIEAARLNVLAAAYGLFGFKLEHQPETEAATWPNPADEAYRATEASTLEAANESSPVELVSEPVVVFEETPAEPTGTALAVISTATHEVATTAAPANEASTALVTVAAKRGPFPKLDPRPVHVAPAHATRLIQIIDWVFVALAAQFAAIWAAGAGLNELTIGDAVSFLLAAGALKVGLWFTNIYKTPPSRLSPEHGAAGLALGAVGGLIVAALIAPDARATAALALVIPVSAVVLAGVHAAFAVWIRAAHKAGVFSENIVIVGATEAAQRLAQRAAERGDARVVAIVDDRLARSPHTHAGIPVSGDINDLLKWESLPHVDRIVITVTQKAESRVRALIERLRIVPNRVDLLLDYETQTVRGKRVDRLTGAAMACVSGRPHNAGRALAKRIQDLVLGSLLFIAFAPVMAALFVAVKLDSRGPALYRQRRHGFNNRIITVLKFRTMRYDPCAPLKQVQKDDPRVTRIGRWLRKTSLDELPQLWNVLKGEMSLVGPRPHAVGMRAADRDLTHIVAEYAHRHRVKPGITGWAQVNGSRGPIETPASVRERVKLDLDYVAQASLAFDLFILARTLPALFGDSKVTR